MMRHERVIHATTGATHLSGEPRDMFAKLRKVWGR